MKTTAEILNGAKAASLKINELTTARKNAALKFMAESLIENAGDILKANKIDVERSRGVLTDVMIDRLSLSEERIKGMADGITALISLKDPVGEVIEHITAENGLDIKKVRVPLGVVAIIYESRPNVTSDAAALCLKSGNVSVLRGGKEAFNSSYEIVKALRKGLKKAGEDENLINFIEDTSRDSANEIMRAKGFVDLLIPRGGAGLIKACVENATVPVIETGTGICHIFVDESADLNKAIKVIENAKASRPSVCNAEEVLLVHKNVADKFLPALYKRLTSGRAKENKPVVTFKCDEPSHKILPEAEAAGDKDFDTEFLNYILAVKVVGGVKEAVEHIAAHSTKHSDAILSNNKDDIEYFTSNVDSAAVYVNASTRFTDGGVFGLGCEMGISTQKLHARGPMGLTALTTYKFIVTGDGHIR